MSTTRSRTTMESSKGTKGKMVNRKMVTKSCPKCDQQIPVACKSCPCGHSFPTRQKPTTPNKQVNAGKERNRGKEKEKQARTTEANQDPLPSTPDLPTRRRTERIKRERPDFYSPEIEYHPRRKRSSPSESSSNADEYKKKRGRPKGALGKSKAEGGNGEKEEDVFANVSAEKALQYSIILAELNQKLVTTSFKPW